LDQRPYITFLAQFKRHYNYPFNVTNKKTPGEKFFRRGHRIQDIRSISFDRPSLDVPKLSCAGTAARQLSSAPLVFNPGTPANSTKNW
jgi:hypothetical protein